MVRYALHRFTGPGVYAMGQQASLQVSHASSWPHVVTIEGLIPKNGTLAIFIGARD
jgi:hypothetical protein